MSSFSRLLVTMIAEPQIHRVSRSVSTRRPVRVSKNLKLGSLIRANTINTCARVGATKYKISFVFSRFFRARKNRCVSVTHPANNAVRYAYYYDRGMQTRGIHYRESIAFFHEESSKERERERENGVSGIYSPTFLSLATIISRVALINNPFLDPFPIH